VVVSPVQVVGHYQDCTSALAVVRMVAYFVSLIHYIGVNTWIEDVYRWDRKDLRYSCPVVSPLHSSVQRKWTS
jgi:hypothetical protein